MTGRIRYSQDQWIRLIEAIEADGGGQATDELGHPDVCTPRTYSFSGPNKLDAKDRVLAGCGNESLFEVMYDPHEAVHLEVEARDYKGNIDPERGTIVIDHSGEAGSQAVTNNVLVCAVCDGIGWWPRYARVMREDAS